MPFWLSFYSSNLLLSLHDVQQPCEDPSVVSSFRIQNSKSSLPSVPTCTMSQCPLGKVSSPITSSSYVPFCPLICLLNALLAELHRILSDSGFLLRTHSRVLLNAPLCICSMPMWQSSSKNSSEILSATMFFSHILAS
jgi:hypothetical protein